MESFPLDEVVLADGFDTALIGVGASFEDQPVAVYDEQKCINILAERDHMTTEEAAEFFEVNVRGAYVGPQTPMFIRTWKPQLN